MRLLPGPFATAQDLDARYLLSLEPDRLLHNFRVNAGLVPKAPVYGGWESQEPWVEIRCQGHTLGHYLSACAIMAGAGEHQFHDRVAYIVEELSACQRARGDGLICAFPDGAAQLENGLNGKPISGVPCISPLPDPIRWIWRSFPCPICSSGRHGISAIGASVQVSHAPVRHAWRMHAND